MHLKRKRLVFWLSMILLVFLVAYGVTMAVIPGTITLFTGEQYTISFKSPLFLQAFSRSSMLKLSDTTSTASNAFERPYSLSCTSQGHAKMDLLMLGLIPVKTVEVRAIDSQQVLACGFPIGIKLKTSGVMIINVSGVILDDGSKVSPGETAGLLAGDVIVKAGGKEIKSIRDLVSVIEGSQGKSVNITYKRKDSQYDTTVQPIKSAEDTQYRIGVWVRDSSAGIGTLTFIDPKNKIYGALGHGINDIDTGSLLQVGSGQLLRSNIRGIKKGVKGVPGELEGDFMEKIQVIGDIEMNCDFGVFGRISYDLRKEKSARLYPIGSHSMVHPGKATILTCIRDEQVEEFEIEIQRISKWDLVSTKNMVIAITDERLLAATGGIVQGMSGSPILQDGRIIGAVTHVFINDPVKGYGVFIESMLERSNAMGKTAAVFPEASGF